MASLSVLPPVLALYGFAPSLALAIPALFVVGFVYIGVLSGLSTVVQLRAPTALRGRVLSLYLVALGVSYPIGSLMQGPLADSLGLAWTTAGAERAPSGGSRCDAGAAAWRLPGARFPGIDIDVSSPRGLLLTDALWLRRSRQRPPPNVLVRSLTP